MKQQKWTKEEIELLDSYIQSSEENTKEKIKEIAELTGRSWSGVQYKYYSRAKEMKETWSMRETWSAPKRQEEPKVVIDKRLASRLRAAAMELNSIADDIDVLENWARDTLEIKKRLYQVDNQGMVHFKKEE